MKKSFLTFSFCFFFLSPLGFARLRLGVDVLRKDDFRSIQGAHVGLITNQTGVNRAGISTVQVFQSTKNIKLVCILTPEHGFKGSVEHGQGIENSVDAESGVPIYSLYGKTTRPTPEMLKGVDTLVFDIQDVGTRFYTYITTMAQAMEEAARLGIHFVVLDRPNPIRGDITEGDVLDPDIKRMTGYYKIPVRHGLTIGELANWINKKEHIKTNLTVIKMKNWKRKNWFDQEDLPFIPPSPNIPTLTSALLYSGIGCFEATNIAVGRGTSSPFEIFGAPWIDGKVLAAHLREKNFAGVLFEPITFLPGADIYKNEQCGGVRMIVTDRNKVRPFQIFITAFLFLSETYPKEFKPEWEEVRVVTGSNKLQMAAQRKLSIDELLAHYQQSLEAFQDDMKSFYLY